MGERRDACRGKSKKSIGRPGRRWEDNIRMVWRGMGWIDLDQDRDRWRAVVNAVMNLWVSQNVGNILTS